MKGHGVSSGVVVPRECKQPVLHSVLESHGLLMTALIKSLDSVGAIPADFPFTVLQILRDAEVGKHVDHNEKDSLSLVISTGNFTGGDLVVNGERGSPFRKPAVFSGAL